MSWYCQLVVDSIDQLGWKYLSNQNICNNDKNVIHCICFIYVKPFLFVWLVTDKIENTTIVNFAFIVQAKEIKQIFKVLNC